MFRKNAKKILTQISDRLGRTPTRSADPAADCDDGVRRRLWCWETGASRLESLKTRAHQATSGGFQLSPNIGEGDPTRGKLLPGKLPFWTA